MCFVLIKLANQSVDVTNTCIRFTCCAISPRSGYRDTFLLFLRLVMSFFTACDVGTMTHYNAISSSPRLPVGS